MRKISIGFAILFLLSLQRISGQNEFQSVDTFNESEIISQLMMDMVLVSGGSFTMGCTAEQEEDCREEERPAHLVSLDDFHIGCYEVTQAQWRAVMGGDAPEVSNKGCDQCPVERDTWEEAQEFIRKLNDRTGMRFRLPCEAEWEYAARGGSLSQGFKFSGSDNIKEVAWFEKNASWGNLHGIRGTTRPVGSKAPNELGIHDMSGNVREWCADWAQGYPGPDEGWDGKGSLRIVRGGSWFDLPMMCRVSQRSAARPDSRHNLVGFRLAADRSE